MDIFEFMRKLVKLKLFEVMGIAAILGVDISKTENIANITELIIDAYTNAPNKQKAFAATLVRDATAPDKDSSHVKKARKKRKKGGRK